jgi:hypothetical protein
MTARYSFATGITIYRRLHSCQEFFKEEERMACQYNSLKGTRIRLYLIFKP